MMAGLGLRFDDIAKIKGMSDDTLKKYALEHLQRGKAKAKLQVMQTAYKMATSGKQPVMTIFWLKTQAQWRERGIEVDMNLAKNVNASNKPTQAVITAITQTIDQMM